MTARARVHCFSPTLPWGTFHLDKRRTPFCCGWRWRPVRFLLQMNSAIDVHSWQSRRRLRMVEDVRMKLEVEAACAVDHRTGGFGLQSLATTYVATYATNIMGINNKRNLSKGFWWWQKSVDGAVNARRVIAYPYIHIIYLCRVPYKRIMTKVGDP